MILTKEQCDEHELTPDEVALISRLLSQPFPGRDVLVEQMFSTRVSWIESNGSPAVLLHVDPAAPRAPVSQRTPIEAELIGDDNDGASIHYVLHVVDGCLAEIEIYREDGEPVRDLPPVAKLRHAYSPSHE